MYKHEMKTNAKLGEVSSILGCGMLQLGSVYDSSVAEIKKVLEQARWTYEAAIVIASTSEKHEDRYHTEENLKAAGFIPMMEAPNVRHEYVKEDPRHKVKLWAIDVSNWPKPEEATGWKPVPYESY